MAISNALALFVSLVLFLLGSVLVNLISFLPDLPCTLLLLALMVSIAHGCSTLLRRFTHSEMTRQELALGSAFLYMVGSAIVTLAGSKITAIWT